MASGLKLVLFVLLLICPSMSYPTSNNSMSSQSTLPTNDIMKQLTELSGSGMCNLTINQSLLETVLKLTQDSTINIVELQLQSAGGSENESRLLPDVTWALANKVGREIVSILSINSVLWHKYINLEAIRTLTVGRMKLAVRIYENPQGCISSNKNETSSAVKMFLQKLFRTSNTEYQLCYVTKTIKKYNVFELEHTCCKIIRKGRQRECYVYSSYLTDTIRHYQTTYITAYMLMLFPLLTFKFIESSRERKYYKITDSPMSLSSVIHSVFFEGYGPVKSVVRRLIFIGVVACVRWQFFAGPFFAFNTSQIGSLYDFFWVIWALTFPLFDVFKKNHTTLAYYFIQVCWSGTAKHFSICSKWLQNHAGYGVENVFLSGDYQSIVNVITLPFNFKRWRKSLKHFFKMKSVRLDLPWQKKIWEFAKRYFWYFWAALFSLFYAVVIFVILLLLIWLRINLYSFSFVLGFLCWNLFSDLEKNKTKCKCFLICFRFVYIGLLVLSMLACVFLFFLLLPIIILLLFAGLILNIVYFIPYITFISVLIFYSWNFWQYVETKYFTLKMQIYEVCKQSVTFHPDSSDDEEDINEWDGENIQNFYDDVDDFEDLLPDDVSEDSDGDGSDDNDNNSLRIMIKWKYDRNNEPMISKQFYNRIRETILPYNLTLFYFFIKVLYVFFFAYFLFAVINILERTDISGTVKVITTMSVSVLPYILNVVAEKLSEERKKAQNEVQKIKVEKLMSELTQGTD